MRSMAFFTASGAADCALSRGPVVELIRLPRSPGGSVDQAARTFFFS